MTLQDKLAAFFSSHKGAYGVDYLASRFICSTTGVRKAMCGVTGVERVQDGRRCLWRRAGGGGV